MIQLPIAAAILLMEISFSCVSCNQKMIPLNVLDPDLRDNTAFDDFFSNAMSDYNSEQGSDSTTFPFIEAMIKRTAEHYMDVIRTEPNWLERILQLVKEERVIRSRYNCSTDSCLFKIQLFPHHLPPHLFESRPVHRKRTRRSIVESESSANAFGEPEISKDTAEPVKQSATFLRRPNRSVANTVHDDALRLPDLTQAQNIDNSAPEGSGHEHNGPLSPPIIYADNEKINMERVSQEVLSEALSRESKLNNPKIPRVSREEDQATTTVVDDSTTPPTDMVFTTLGMTDDVTEKMQNEESDLLVTQETTPIPLTTLTQVADQTLSSSTASIPIPQEQTTDNPKDSTVQTDKSESSHQTTQTEQTSTESPAKPTPRPKIPEPIPFGMNRFVGEGYQNCTGRYIHYCLNALKCVYISVLETAVCYCRPGYTGVRCDMFNLPQTLDILKSFRRDETEITLYQDGSAEAAFGAVEATVRYAVNAVLEVELHSG